MTAGHMLTIALGGFAAALGFGIGLAGARKPADEPKRFAMLIGGTMLCAFGIAIAGMTLASQGAGVPR